jgi:hypothetical protein
MQFEPGRRVRAIGTGAVLVLASGALGQQLNTQVGPASLPQPAREAGGLTRVEPVVSDTDPLRTSLRTYPTDLRQPMGFKEIFRINGSAAQAQRLGFSSATGQDLLARRDGAVTAVFPQSVYREAKNGAVPLIPPGTIFFIGDLPVDPFEGQGDRPDDPSKVHSRVDTRLETAPPGSRLATPDPTPLETTDGADRAKDVPAPAASIMTDESLRGSSVRMLLQKAAESAEGKREDGGARPGEAKKGS